MTKYWEYWLQPDLNSWVRGVLGQVLSRGIDRGSSEGPVINSFGYKPGTPLLIGVDA